jgi:ubiquinone/menaquinone biosynthesis C-methylase UbiE
MSFDTLAPIYRGMETVTAGRIMQDCRTSFLTATANCRRALLLGEGPGRFLVELLRINPQIEVTCVERSPRMIQVALRHLNRHGLNHTRMTFVPADALAWQPPEGKFDLVVTHFFLDCFPPHELTLLIPKIAACTGDGAHWLLADFQVPERGWRAWRARMILSLLYAFFRVATGLSASRLTPPDAFLEAAGFRLVKRRLNNFDLVHSDLWRRTS